MATKQLPDLQAWASSQSTPLPPSLTERFGGRIVSWLKTCRDYHAAAGIYDELRGLSDAELKRRGLSRETLARDICSAYDSSSARPGTTKLAEPQRHPPMPSASALAMFSIIGKVRAR